MLAEEIYYQPNPPDPELKERRIREIYENRGIEEMILDMESGHEWIERAYD